MTEEEYAATLARQAEDRKRFERQAEAALTFGGKSASRLEAETAPSAERPRERKAREDREHAEQRRLMEWAAELAKTSAELRMLFAIPNGGGRSKATAGKLRAEGVRSGVPDLFLAVARGGRHGLFVEMKAKGGSVSLNQMDWIRALEIEGYRAEVCVGAEAAKAVILEYLNWEG